MIKIKEKVYHKDLGLIDYKKAWDIQEKLLKGLVDLKVANRELRLEEQIKAKHHLLFCEHPPVITLGRSGSIENLLFNESFLKSKGIQFYKNNRGVLDMVKKFESGVSESKSGMEGVPNKSYYTLIPLGGNVKSEKSTLDIVDKVLKTCEELDRQNSIKT